MSAALFTFVVSAIGGSGPNATSVFFTKTPNNVRPWAWIPNNVATNLAPGMQITVTQVSWGKQTDTYRDNGQQVALKVPRCQVFLGGDIIIDAPEQSLLPEAKFQITEAAARYRDTYIASREKEAVVDGDEPI